MLQIILGPMLAGKTDHVMRLSKRYKAIGKNVLIIDHSLDVRYSTTHLVSHNGDKEECIFLSNVGDVLSIPEYRTLYDAADVVIIEEAQFFLDLETFIRNEIDKTDKDFIVSGLSGDIYRNPIGYILNIIPLAEYVDKLNGLCQICKDGTAGAFTKRIGDTTDQIIIGEKDIYECVCRKHYLE